MKKLNWGWRIAIVYTFFAVSTIGFVAFAMTKKVELVRADYYEHSLEHDATSAARARATALDDAVKINETAQKITVLLPAHHANASGKITFYRPSAVSLDRSITIVKGSAEALTSDLLPGRYRLVIEWKHNSQDYLAERNIEIGGK
jgi:hypothetical protein